MLQNSKSQSSIFDRGKKAVRRQERSKSVTDLCTTKDCERKFRIVWCINGVKKIIPLSKTSTIRLCSTGSKYLQCNERKEQYKGELGPDYKNAWDFIEGRPTEHNTNYYLPAFSSGGTRNKRGCIKKVWNHPDRAPLARYDHIRDICRQEGDGHYLHCQHTKMVNERLENCWINGRDATHSMSKFEPRRVKPNVTWASTNQVKQHHQVKSESIRSTHIACNRNLNSLDSCATPFPCTRPRSSIAPFTDTRVLTSDANVTERDFTNKVYDRQNTYVMFPLSKYRPRKLHNSDKNFSHVTLDPDSVLTSTLETTESSSSSQTHLTDTSSSSGERHSKSESTSSSSSGSSQKESCVDTGRISSVHSRSHRDKSTNTPSRSEPVTLETHSRAGGDWYSTSASELTDISNSHFEYKHVGEILTEAGLTPTAARESSHWVVRPNRAHSVTSGYRPSRALTRVRLTGPRCRGASVHREKETQGNYEAKAGRRHTRSHSFSGSATTMWSISGSTSSSSSSSESDTPSRRSQRQATKGTSSLSAENYFLCKAFSAGAKNREKCPRGGCAAPTRFRRTVSAVVDHGEHGLDKNTWYREGCVEPAAGRKNKIARCGDDKTKRAKVAEREGDRRGEKCRKPSLIPGAGCWIRQWEDCNLLCQHFKVIPGNNSEWKNKKYNRHPAYHWTEQVTGSKDDDKIKKGHARVPKGIPIPYKGGRIKENISKKEIRKRETLNNNKKFEVVKVVRKGCYCEKKGLGTDRKNLDDDGASIEVKPPCPPTPKSEKCPERKQGDVRKSGKESSKSETEDRREEAREPQRTRKAEGADKSRKVEDDKRKSKEEKTEKQATEKLKPEQEKMRKKGEEGTDRERAGNTVKKEKTKESWLSLLCGKKEEKEEVQAENEAERKKEREPTPKKPKEETLQRKRGDAFVEKEGKEDRRKETKGELRHQEEEERRRQDAGTRQSKDGRLSEEKEATKKELDAGVAKSKKSKEEQQAEKDEDRSTRQKKDSEPKDNPEQQEKSGQPKGRQEKEKKDRKEGPKTSKDKDGAGAEVNQNKKTEGTDSNERPEKKKPSPEKKGKDAAETKLKDDRKKDQKDQKDQKDHSLEPTNSAVYDAALRFFTITGMSHFAKLLLDQMETLRNQNRALKFYAPQRKGLYVTPQPYPLWIYPNDPLGLYKYFLKIRGRSRSEQQQQQPPTPTTVTVGTSCYMLNKTDTSNRSTAPRSSSLPGSSARSRLCSRCRASLSLSSASSGFSYRGLAPAARQLDRCGGREYDDICGRIAAHRSPPSWGEGFPSCRVNRARDYPWYLDHVCRKFTGRYRPYLWCPALQQGQLHVNQSPGTEEKTSALERKRTSSTYSTGKSNNVPTLKEKSSSRLGCVQQPASGRNIGRATSRKRILTKESARRFSSVESSERKSSVRTSFISQLQREHSVDPPSIRSRSCVTKGQSGQGAISRRSRSKVPSDSVDPPVWKQSVSRTNYARSHMSSWSGHHVDPPFWMRPVLPTNVVRSPPASLNGRRRSEKSVSFDKSSAASSRASNFHKDRTRSLAKEKGRRRARKILSKHSSKSKKRSRKKKLLPTKGKKQRAAVNVSSDSHSKSQRPLNKPAEKESSGQVHSTQKPHVGEHFRKSATDENYLVNQSSHVSDKSFMLRDLLSENESHLTAKPINPCRKLEQTRQYLVSESSSRSTGLHHKTFGVQTDLSGRCRRSPGISRKLPNDFLPTRRHYKCGLNTICFSSFQSPFYAHPYGHSSKRGRKPEARRHSNRVSYRDAKETDHTSEENLDSERWRRKSGARRYSTSVPQGTTNETERAAEEQLDTARRRRQKSKAQPLSLSQSRRVSVVSKRISKEHFQNSSRQQKPKSPPHSSSVSRHESMYSDRPSEENLDATVLYQPHSTSVSPRRSREVVYLPPQNYFDVARERRKSEGSGPSTSVSRPGSEVVIGKQQGPKLFVNAPQGLSEKAAELVGSSRDLVELSEKVSATVRGLSVKWNKKSENKRPVRRMTHNFIEYNNMKPPGQIEKEPKTPKRRAKSRSSKATTTSSRSASGSGSVKPRQDPKSKHTSHVHGEDKKDKRNPALLKANIQKMQTDLAKIVSINSGQPPATEESQDDKVSPAVSAKSYSSADPQPGPQSDVSVEGQTFTVFCSSNPSADEKQGISPLSSHWGDLAPTRQPKSPAPQDRTATIIVSKQTRPATRQICARCAAPSNSDKRDARKHPLQRAAGKRVKELSDTSELQTKSVARTDKGADSTTASTGGKPPSYPTTDLSSSVTLTQSRRPYRPYSTLHNDRAVLNLTPATFPTVGSTGYFSYRRYRQTLESRSADAFRFRPLSTGKYGSLSSKYPRVGLSNRYDTVSKYSPVRYSAASYAPRSAYTLNSNVFTTRTYLQ